MKKRFSHTTESQLEGLKDLQVEIRQTRIEGELYLNRTDLMRLVAEMVEAQVPAAQIAQVLAQMFLEADLQRPTN